MPTYDYQCDACDHEFELFQRINEPVKRKCPECGRLKLKRLIGPGAAIVFKGSGFYKTDYRSQAYKKKAEAEKKAASDDGNGSSKEKGKSNSTAPADKKSVTK